MGRVGDGDVLVFGDDLGVGRIGLITFLHAVDPPCAFSGEGVGSAGGGFRFDLAGEGLTVHPFGEVGHGHVGVDLLGPQVGVDPRAHPGSPLLDLPDEGVAVAVLFPELGRGVAVGGGDHFLRELLRRELDPTAGIPATDRIGQRAGAVLDQSEALGMQPGVGCGERRKSPVADQLVDRGVPSDSVAVDECGGFAVDRGERSADRAVVDRPVPAAGVIDNQFSVGDAELAEGSVDPDDRGLADPAFGVDHGALVFTLGGLVLLREHGISGSRFERDRGFRGLDRRSDRRSGAGEVVEGRRGGGGRRPVGHLWHVRKVFRGEHRHLRLIGEQSIGQGAVGLAGSFDDRQGHGCHPCGHSGHGVVDHRSCSRVICRQCRALRLGSALVGRGEQDWRCHDPTAHEAKEA